MRRSPPPYLSPTPARHPSSSTARADDALSTLRPRNRITNAVFWISSSVAIMHSHVERLDAAVDAGAVGAADDVKSQLRTQTEYARSLVARTRTDLAIMERDVGDASFNKHILCMVYTSNHRRAQHEKLHREFQEVLKRFQHVSGLAAESVRRCHEAKRAAALQEEADRDDTNETQPLLRPHSSVAPIDRYSDFEAELRRMEHLFWLGDRMNVTSPDVTAATDIEAATNELLLAASAHNKRSRMRRLCLLLVVVAGVCVGIGYFYLVMSRGDGDGRGSGGSITVVSGERAGEEGKGRPQ